MKKAVKITSFVLLACIVIFCVASCAKVEKTGLWENATYLSDKTLGKGENVITVVISAEEQSITITIKTDKATLGEALYEHELINDPTFFDTCNGMKADWDKDNAYWAFYVGEEYAMYGVGDARAVTTGEPTYKFVYTK